jgi:hypothetical protein
VVISTQKDQYSTHYFAVELQTRSNARHPRDSKTSTGH